MLLKAGSKQPGNNDVGIGSAMERILKAIFRSPAPGGLHLVSQTLVSIVDVQNNLVVERSFAAASKHKLVRNHVAPRANPCGARCVVDSVGAPRVARRNQNKGA